MRWALVVLSMCLPGNAYAQSVYEPPEGCQLVATLRDANCIVRHVSACPSGNIADHFQEGMYGGRAFYGHPSLFLRFEGATGYVAGHSYGDGAPELGRNLEPGDVFTYTRSVYRNIGDGEPGDEGTETLTVGQPLTATIGGRDYTVVDLLFDVTAEGFRYRERALMLKDPPLTIGVTSSTYGADGSVETSFSSIPESISVAGDPDLGGFEPAPSCLPSS